MPKVEIDAETVVVACDEIIAERGDKLLLYRGQILGVYTQMPASPPFNGERKHKPHRAHHVNDELLLQKIKAHAPVTTTQLCNMMNAHDSGERAAISHRLEYLTKMQKVRSVRRDGERIHTWEMQNG